MKLFKRLATAIAAVMLTLSTISITSAADWKAAYREQLVYMRDNKYSYCASYGTPKVTYTVYDIDKDGTKELIVEVGSCEADRTTYFYTYSGGKVVSLGSKNSSHALLNGCNGNGILMYSAHMDHETELKITKSGNKLYTTVIFDRTSYNCQVPSYYMTLISAYDYSYVPY